MAAHRALIAAALALAALAGCQVPQRVPPVLVLASYGAPSRETFERLTGVVRSNGYEIAVEDVEHGTFRVNARYADRGAPVGSHAFSVQLYASGHAEIVAFGPRVEPLEGGYQMPPALRRELVALAQALER